MTKDYDWAAEFARAEQAHDRAEQFADGLLTAATPELHPWERDLLHARAAAVRAEAWAFAAYAEHCESMMNADVEKMQTRAHYEEQARQAKAAPGVYSEAQANTFGGRVYDVPRCSHGCCASAVCDWVGDCDSHKAAS